MSNGTEQAVNNLQEQARQLERERQQDRGLLGYSYMGLDWMGNPIVDPKMQAATIDAAPQAQFRTGQQGLATSLQSVIDGQAPSVAQMQGQRAAAENMAAQMSLAAGARGSNMALARRQAAANVGQLNARAGLDAALVRAQESATARGQLGGVLQQARGADLGLATEQAGLQQQAASANLGADLQSRGMDLTEQSNLRRDTLAASQIEQDAGKTAYDSAQRSAERENDAWRDLENAGTSMISMGASSKGSRTTSDRRVKTGIADESPSALMEFLGAIKPSAFNYRDPAKHGEGRRHGVMAQDLERSEIGKSLVRDDEDGVKVIDVPKAVGAMLAATSFLHGRMRKLEGNKQPLHKTLALVAKRTP